ncbi:ABC transporter permease subunit [Mammaliicoccus sp. Dog046]|uniref:ABC transporter permease subunit n=1 Tax=Mammaliicoccus sp. Dog046 TaxID=3034233 RepID=UPI002B25FB46|nr:ABC transporter permease subunit [Mammaliicoccus sp. Dog046]WQK86183.1 ABC transporter permease subunit [Mammaliicoccus sp. Dog046]
MNIGQLIKYDITNIFKSPLGYLGILISLLPGIGVIIATKTLEIQYSASMVLTMFIAFGGLVLLMFSIRTITRDIQYGTIQLFLNSKRNRTKYLYGKLLSVLCIIIIFTIIGTIFTLFSTTIMDSGKLEALDYLKTLGIFTLVIGFFISLLNIINLTNGKPAIVYTTAILLMFFLPTIFAASILVPKIGETLAKMMKYNPFDFLPAKLNAGSLSMTGTQILISLACIVVFVAINHYIIRNKNI